MDSKKSLAETKKKDYETANADYTADLAGGTEPDEDTEDTIKWKRRALSETQ